MFDNTDAVSQNSLKLIFKQVHSIGKTKVVSIDESIVKKLNLSGENTFLQQEVTEDGKGILMRVRNVEV